MSTLIEEIHTEAKKLVESDGRKLDGAIFAITKSLDLTDIKRLVEEINVKSFTKSFTRYEEAGWTTEKVQMISETAREFIRSEILMNMR